MQSFLIIGNKYPEKVVPLIEAATQSIDIIIYEWRIYKSRPTHPCTVFTRALANAARRRVAVRALVASDGLRDDLRRLGIEARASYTGKLLHAKLLLIDKKIAVLGSHNFTQSAFTQNIEVSAAIVSAELCRDLSTYFDNLYGL